MISDGELQQMIREADEQGYSTILPALNELLALRKAGEDKKILEIENRRLNVFLEMMRSDFKELKSRGGIENNHVFHMGKATDLFSVLRENKVSESVKDSELGPMGAVNVEVWTSLFGGTLHYEQSMGGCSLYIFPEPSDPE